MSAPLIALATATFAIGTTEYVIMGLLPILAQDLHVSVPQAGFLVSGYALGVALGSPLVAIATAKLPRKSTLLGLMTLFILGNAGCALAPNYTLLLLARVVTSLAHGSFFGIGSVVAVGLVPRERRARAVAFLVAGLTLANVLGVPLGTALGQAAGWRATFWAVMAVGFVAATALGFAIPSRSTSRGGGVAREFAVIRKWRVLLPILISMISSASLFSVFTYIAPILEHVADFGPRQVTWVLLLFGVGLTIGNLIGGRLADWRRVPSIVGCFILLVLVLVGFAYSIYSQVPAVVTMTIWAALAFALISPLQTWVVDAASEAPNLASTLNQSAFNLGNSIGAWLGGAAIGYGIPYADLPLLGATLAVGGLCLTLIAALHRVPVSA
jgi:MFS transporter, DHA1 family, inner membrane transport protein